MSITKELVEFIENAREWATSGLANETVGALAGDECAKLLARATGVTPGEEVEIRFDITASIKQRVVITDEKITPHVLQQLLRRGTAVTTIQEGGTVEIFVPDSDDTRTIGQVLEVEVGTEGEYRDFEVEKD